MGTVLLTGAGFSRNWGGRLAREFNATVAMRLRNDRALADLFDHNSNFEEALADLQNTAVVSNRSDAAAQLQRLESAIIDAFAEMNRNLGTVNFEFSNYRSFSIKEFLALFDAIFTLNQDLLLEAHYHYPADNLSHNSSGRWLGPVLPATEVIPDPSPTGLFDLLSVRRRPVQSPRFVIIDSQYQPYFKLHGSMNWHDPNGGHLLVMGGNKPTSVARHPILMWYADKFLEYLSRPHARLMIIGYGFRDNHINALIEKAWHDGGETLSMFIIHPEGRDILRRVNPTFDKPLYHPRPIESITAYDSVRSLPEIFGGKDPGERDVLTTFVRGG
jgi:hypothetical protein